MSDSDSADSSLEDNQKKKAKVEKTAKNKKAASESGSGSESDEKPAKRQKLDKKASSSKESGKKSKSKKEADPEDDGDFKVDLGNNRFLQARLSIDCLIGANFTNWRVLLLSIDWLIDLDGQLMDWWFVQPNPISFSYQVREFHGKALVDIREFYTDSHTAELKPGKKGISLNHEQWKKLVKNISRVDKALEEMWFYLFPAETRDRLEKITFLFSYKQFPEHRVNVCRNSRVIWLFVSCCRPYSTFAKSYTFPFICLSLSLSTSIFFLWGVILFAKKIVTHCSFQRKWEYENLFRTICM